jgi:hypothetical protein
MSSAGVFCLCALAPVAFVRHVFGGEISEAEVVSSVVRDIWRALCHDCAPPRHAEKHSTGSILSEAEQNTVARRTIATAGLVETSAAWD